VILVVVVIFLLIVLPYALSEKDKMPLADTLNKDNTADISLNSSLLEVKILSIDKSNFTNST